MQNNATIVVTGAAGFIGSCLTGFLNEKGYNNLILVDDFSRLDKVRLTWKIKNSAQKWNGQLFLTG